MSGSSDRLDWLVGLFYLNHRDNQGPFPVLFGESLTAIPGGIVVDLYSAGVKINAYAGYADATYRIGDKIFATLGARYSYEKSRAFWNIPALSSAFGTGGSVGPGRVDFEGDWSSFTPRAVLRYQMTPQSNVYASYSKGFKSGLLTPNGFDTTPLRPEKIDAYEVGYKYGGHALRLALAAFYYDYKDLQVAAFVSGTGVYRNAATSEIYGGEASAAARLSDELQIDAGVAYTHARYKKFLGSSLYASNGLGGFAATPIDASGFQMQRAPDWTGNVSIDWRKTLGDFAVGLNGNAYFTSKFPFDTAQAFYQKGYTVVNIGASFGAADKSWENNRLCAQSFRHGVSHANSSGQFRHSTGFRRAGDVRCRSVLPLLRAGRSTVGEVCMNSVYEDVEISVTEGVGTLSIARANANNTVRVQTLREICEALDTLNADESVKAIVLSGQGKHFSAGADFSFLDDLTAMDAPQIRRQVYTHFQGAARRLYTSAKPTVALVQGAAVTVGCELALACDFRLLSSNAFLQESWVKLGIMPPLGWLFLLPRYVGLGRATNMVLRGEKLTAAEALATGLATEIVELEQLAERGTAFARDLTAIAPLAYAAIKEALHRGLETGMETEWSANVSTQATLLKTNDFEEALAAIKGNARRSSPEADVMETQHSRNHSGPSGASRPGRQLQKPRRRE